MKFTQRLDYSRLAEALTERDMVALATVQELLNASNEGGQAFPEALIDANLIPDWDLSRVVSDVFNLPFLPVEQAKPNKDLLSLFDRNFLRSSALVPVARYGNVLTIAMPAIVQADTLALLSAETDMFLLPIVSTVSSNRKWLAEHCPQQRFGDDNSWGSLFDEGDQAVQETLGGKAPEASTEGAFGLEGLGTDEDLDLKGFDIESVGVDYSDSEEGLLEGLETPLVDDLGSFEEESGLNTSNGGTQPQADEGDVDLPPMPDFK
ncbi:MAG: hypothetical protein KDB61_01290 [Planctomycetes bacterium]|nr:hypothetical protein [Planctomycetota bacterium]